RTASGEDVGDELAGGKASSLVRRTRQVEIRVVIAVILAPGRGETPFTHLVDAPALFIGVNESALLEWARRLLGAQAGGSQNAEDRGISVGTQANRRE